MSEQDTPIVDETRESEESTPTVDAGSASSSPSEPRQSTPPNALDLYDSASEIQAVIHNFPATIGNALVCDLPLKGPGPSGVYARVRRESGAFIIEQAHSDIPLVISDKQLRSVILADDDRIILGEHEIRVRFTYVDPDEAETAKPRAGYRLLIAGLQEIDWADRLEAAKQWVRRLLERIQAGRAPDMNHQEVQEASPDRKTSMPRRKLWLYAAAAGAAALILASFISLLSGPEPRAKGVGMSRSNTASPAPTSAGGNGRKSSSHSAPAANNDITADEGVPPLVSRQSVPNPFRSTPPAPDAVSPDSKAMVDQSDNVSSEEVVQVSRYLVPAVTAESPSHDDVASKLGTSARLAHRGSGRSQPSTSAASGVDGTSAHTHFDATRKRTLDRAINRAHHDYRVGDAPAALEALARISRAGLSAEDAARLEATRDAIHRAFTAYSNTRQADAEHAPQVVMVNRQKLVRAEQRLHLEGNSTYRISLDHLVLPILRHRAAVAYESHDMAGAYRLYTGVLGINADDALARRRQREILARAKAYYVQGYRLEPKDLKAAIYYWQKAAELLPSGTRWHDQASAKINQYKALLTQG